MQRTLILTVALALALAGCAQPENTDMDDGGAAVDGDDGAGGAEPQDLPRTSTFVATDFAFDGPSEMPSGWNEVIVRNDGQQLHHLLFMRLDEGTYEDFTAMLETGAAAAAGENATEDENATAHADPESSSFGGPNAVHPGKSETAYVRLEPGDYVVVCWIPTQEGAPHAFHGMHRPLTVVQADDEGAPPEADVTLTMDDFSFALDANLTAGRQVVKVVNVGQEDHEAPLIELMGNATAMDFVGAFGPNGTWPPPGKGAGGMNSIEPGATAYFVADLTAGRYALICFEGGEEGPHFLHGMIHEFDVA